MVSTPIVLVWSLLTELEIEDEDQRKKVLHLVLCLLPKAHRDTMEVLFCFLNWVSSFHTVDEETGNKMDTWNIATVMAPNILRESNDKEVKNVDQAAVKVVFDLIENNDEFSEVCLLSMSRTRRTLTNIGSS
jgi:galactose-1-phosphate uridylyltransferase